MTAASSDNRLRQPEWVRMIGDFLPPRLGGDRDAWEAENRGVFRSVWGHLAPRMPEFEGFRAFHRAYSLAWMEGMCERVGVTLPAPDDAVALHRELSVYIAERAVCAYEGAAEAVRALHEAAYRLHMASGTPSWELRGILQRMGVLDCFDGLYGPDITDRVKHGTGFYQSIFAHAGVPASNALVLESDRECCGWAIATGALAVQVDEDGAGDVSSLAAFASKFLEGQA